MINVNTRSLLTADWSQLHQPHVWLEAVCQVVMSLYLGLGVYSTFASNNNYCHNIIRDTIIVICGHLVWVSMSTVLVAAIIGMTQINIDTDIGGLLDTLVVTSLAMGTMSQGWLWLGLVFILIIIITITNTLGYLTVITSICPNIRKTISTPISLALLFFLSLIICNEAGPNIFLFVTTMITRWQPIMFSLVTVLMFCWCHDIRYHFKLIG